MQYLLSHQNQISDLVHASLIYQDGKYSLEGMTYLESSLPTSMRYYIRIHLSTDMPNKLLLTYFKTESFQFGL